MRWEQLFADLDAQFDAERRRAEELDVVDQTRAARAEVGLADRLRAHLGTRVELRVSGAGQVRGELVRVGRDFLLVEGSSETLVRLAAVQAVVDLPQSAAPEPSPGDVDRRLGLRSVLRALAADRAFVDLVLTDATTVAGTPARIGSDMLDLSVHELGVVPRPSAVREVWSVAYASVATVVRRSEAW